MQRFQFYFCAALILFSQPVLAAETSMFGLGVESFVWKEYDSDGSQLLKESGPRYVLTYQYKSERAESISYEFFADFYFGDVDYDGQTQTAIPVTSTTQYTGLRAEVLVDYHFLEGASSSLAFIGGLGGDGWSRDLKDTTTSSGAPVSGYTENYLMIYGKLGLSLQFGSPEWRQNIKVGARRPIYTEETIDEFFVTLNPKPTTTLFAGWDQRWTMSQDTTMGLSIYYEHTRFDPSDVELSAIGYVYQPESDMQVVGAKLLYSF